MKKSIKYFATTLIWMVAASTVNAALREGIDFTIAGNPAPAPQADALVRITEFFNFSCPSCNAYLPAVEAWRAKLPDNTVWVRSPLAFTRWNGLYARTQYVLEAFGREDLVPAVFAAIHVERKLMNSEERVTEWLANEHGLDAAEVEQAFDSFAVATKLKRTERLIERFGIQSTPTFVVADRYMLSPSLSRTPDQLFATLDELIEAIRAGTLPL